MAKTQNITHYQSSNETEAQDKFAAALLAAYAKQSGQPAPAPVDNSAWKPAQAEPKRGFPFKEVVFCAAVVGIVFYFGVLA